MAAASNAAILRAYMRVAAIAMAYIPLFCRSYYSPTGVSSPAELVRRARAVGYGTLGLCDEGTIAGFIAFDEACRDAGIRPVFGCRLTVEGFALTGERFPLDVLIETEQGYRNLVRLLTRSHQRGEAPPQPLTVDDLAGRTAGLTLVIPPDGELAALIRLRDRPRAEAFLERATGIAGQALVLGLDTADSADADLVVRLARFIGARACVAARVRYAEPGDAAAAVWLDHPERAPGRTFDPPEDPKALPALWPEVEVLKRWPEPLDEAAHATGDVARRCSWRPGKIRRVFPAMDLERGYDAGTYLFDLAIRGATQRYGEIDEALKQRINREFEDLRANNLAPYMLLCHRIALALDERGIARGVGRGRLITSVIAYCLGITRIDPLEYNLVYQSLLAEGETCPPIVLEIPRSGVEPLIHWLRETFGGDHVAEIGRLQEIRREQLINELAAWAGMTADERRMVHKERSRLRSPGAASRLNEWLESGKRPRWRDPAFLGDVAARLAPRPRQWTSDGSRYVISSEPLEGVVPRVRSQQERPVVGLDEAAVDRVGLARLQFVPQQLIDILDQATRSARALHPELNLRQIPQGDRAAFELLARGATAGIPPLERVAVRCLLRRHKPVNLLQLLRVLNEASAGRASERPPEVGQQLPDVLLSYHCAYLKAHHPLAFYGAAIGAVVEHRLNPIALVREARRAGYTVHPPDVNLSDWGATVHSGAIRLGLGAIRHVGLKAWENLSAVRSGGPFTSFENFLERIDDRIFNVRIVRALIGAGAFDELDPRRARLDALAQRLHRRNKEAARSGTDQATLFELDRLADAAADAGFDDGEAAEAWAPLERMQREIDALGFPLSVDPVERFVAVLKHLRPMRIEQVTPRWIGRTLRVVGLVGQGESEGPLIREPGEVLVDLEGVPLRIPKPLAENAAYCLEPGVEVLAVGELTRDEGFLSMAVTGIWRLADLEEQAAKVGKVELDLSGENRSTLKLLLALADRYPGTSELILTGYPGRRGWTFRSLARRRVFFCSPLYLELCRVLSRDAVTLYGLQGETLRVRLPAEPEGHDEGSPAPAPPADAVPGSNGA